jgi:N-acetyl-anhydromuramyl-L-alanine amidase AmpD
MTFTTSTDLSPNHYAGHDGRIWIVMHTMEAPETERTAENVASYFKGTAVQASAHWCVDDNSRVRCVRDNDSAWTIAHQDGNRISLNIELAGYAAQTSGQWDDKFSDEELKVAAWCAAEWCHKYDIPVRRLNNSQIRNMHDKGFLGHRDVNNVFHWSTHTDPGPYFPWEKFLNMVRDALNTIEAPKPPKPPQQPRTPGHIAYAAYGASLNWKLGGHDIPFWGRLSAAEHAAWEDAAKAVSSP